MKRFLGGMALVIVLLGSGMVSVGQANVFPQNGEQRQFYGDGTPKAFWKYKNGKLVIKRTYYRNGRLSLERRYKNGQLIRQRKFYENGHPESDWDSRTMVTKVYDKEGRLKQTINSNPQDMGAYKPSYIADY